MSELSDAGLLTIFQTAEQTGLTPGRIRQLIVLGREDGGIDRGGIRSVRIHGKAVFVPMDQIDKIKQQPVTDSGKKSGRPRGKTL